MQVHLTFTNPCVPSGPLRPRDLDPRAQNSSGSSRDDGVPQTLGKSPKVRQGRVLGVGALRPCLPSKVRSDHPRGPGLPARASRQPGSPGTGPQGPCCYRASPEPDRKKGPSRQASRKTGGEEVAPPAPSARSQPLGPTLRGVIGSGGRRRAGGDSRETARLSAAICLSGRDRPGRCGPGSLRPRPPAWADQGLRGSRARPLNGAGWRQGSGRRGSGRGDGDGRQCCPPLPSFLRTQQAKARMHAPRGTSAAGHRRRAPRVTRAQPRHTPKPPRTWYPPQASAPLPAGTCVPSATGPCPPGHHSRRIPAQGHSPRRRRDQPREDPRRGP